VICDDCWLGHEGECPLTTVLPMILPWEVTEDDVRVELPEDADVQFYRLDLVSVVIVQTKEPFDSRKVVAAMKTWIGESDQEEGGDE
jgi:hypothetical protein